MTIGNRKDFLETSKLGAQRKASGAKSALSGLVCPWTDAEWHDAFPTKDISYYDIYQFQKTEGAAVDANILSFPS